MSRLVVIVCVIALAACASLTPREKHVLAIAAAIIVTAVIVAHSRDHGDSDRRGISPPDCVVHPDQCQ
jgi:hypothetical protein